MYTTKQEGTGATDLQQELLLLLLRHFQSLLLLLGLRRQPTQSRSQHNISVMPAICHAADLQYQQLRTTRKLIVWFSYPQTTLMHWMPLHHHQHHDMPALPPAARAPPPAPPPY